MPNHKKIKCVNILSNNRYIIIALVMYIIRWSDCGWQIRKQSFHTFSGTYIIGRLIHTILFVGRLIISLFFSRIADKTKTLVRHWEVVIYKKHVYILLILNLLKRMRLLIGWYNLKIEGVEWQLFYDQIVNWFIESLEVFKHVND